MMANPRVGQRVEIRYRRSLRDLMPLQGKVGVVRIASRGKPRNHGVEVDGRLYCIPCGNLFKRKEPSDG